jgi:ATP-dependent Lon protease
MDELDQKLNATFDGKVLRKDLLHRIKKGTNVPTFVLEFLLAKYCASNDQAEMDAGMEAVLSSLQENYVRPDEANAAQSKVATKGKHRFIDKVHVRYVEKEKRHWASLENFNSQRIAIGEKFYRDNDRLLEGGIWAEVTLAHNDIDEDDYAFSIEDLRPIQLTRFDFERYTEGRAAFTRDEWIAAVLRSVGWSPASCRNACRCTSSPGWPPGGAQLQLHRVGPARHRQVLFLQRVFALRHLDLGRPGDQGHAVLQQRAPQGGLGGLWDTVAFDEVGGIKVRDPDTIQIMKDFMANGRFSRGAEVIADASLSFVGNIDVSVQQVVNSNEHDLFQPLPPELDLAVMDRFAAYIPGWEMPKNSSEFLTSNYGFITDYLAEAFHYQFKHTNRYEEVSKRIRLGKSIEGRDEKGIKKTVCAFLKVLHPNGPPTDEEFEEYVAYATECRRRVKEQMNKRKPDDEFARINLSYFKASGEEVVVFCPESKDAPATQEPARRRLNQADEQPEAVEVQPLHSRHLLHGDSSGPDPGCSGPGGWAVTGRTQGTALHHPLWRHRVQL